MADKTRGRPAGSKPRLTRVLHRRELEAHAGRREFEARLLAEFQEQEKAAQARAKQREQDFALQVTAQARPAGWPRRPGEAESETKARARHSEPVEGAAGPDRERAG